MTSERGQVGPRPLPIGVSDYAEVVKGGFWNADKTLLVRDILDSKMKVILFCRPRRFGKTLNMSMLRYFFERPGDDPEELPDGVRPSTARLFEDKLIWGCGEEYTGQQGRYPVVSITLKDLHYATYSEVVDGYAALIAAECGRHPELADSARCEGADRAAFARLRSAAPEGVDLEQSLLLLTRMLHAHWGVACVVIVDEYDVPIQEGHAHGFYDEAVRFTRNLLGAALKDNPHLAFGFMTGILRVAKDSIFSGLNNVEVDTVLDRRFAPYFGFTREEARALLEENGASDGYQDLLDWYDGYRFGQTEVLNPWSTLKFVRGGCEPLEYWTDTSGNSIIGEVLAEVTPQIEADLERLLQGEAVRATVSTSIVYPQIRLNPDSVWSFLLVTGYLTVRDMRVRVGKIRCDLVIPNSEVRGVFEREVVERFVEGSRRREFADAFSDALFDLDAPALESSLRDLLLASASYHDAAGESFFHGLLLGLCAMAGGDYALSSNREEGSGRYDLQMEPRCPQRGLPGIIIEVKASRDPSDGSLDELAASALSQVRERDYGAGMRLRGVSRVASYGAAFRGKEARVAMDVR